MVGLFLSLWNATGLNKLWPYLIVALTVTASLVAAYMQGRSHGATAASEKQLTGWLKDQASERKQRASIERMSTSVAREQLRKRWSKK